MFSRPQSWLRAPVARYLTSRSSSALQLAVSRTAIISSPSSSSSSAVFSSTIFNLAAGLSMGVVFPQQSHVLAQMPNHMYSRAFSSDAMPYTKLEEPKARAMFKDCDCVCFDVDSTVTQEEGIDVLAGALGKGEAVAELTRKAMGGTMTFQEAISARLKLIEPSRKQIDDLNARHEAVLTPGLAELVDTLRAKGKEVIFVTGGLKQMVLPIATRVGVPEENIFSINLFFHDDAEGSYKGFDLDAFTASSFGKRRAVAHIKETRGFARVAMIGDGATDVETRPVADVMVGFGGNVERVVVKEACDWWVTDMQTLTKELETL